MSSYVIQLLMLTQIHGNVQCTSHPRTFSGPLEMYRALVAPHFRRSWKCAVLIHNTETRRTVSQPE